jgi:pimeloyl-ACP methyl ester carboxylesterase
MRYILLGLAFAASAVLYTDTAHAASSRLFLYEEVIRVEIDENGEEYEVYDTITTTVEDGGSYPVDLDYIYQLGMESDAEIDRVPPPQHIVSFKGKLYRTDDSGERHHVADLFGPDGEWEHVWGTAGNYELDVYAWDEPVPILSEVPWWKRMITLVDFLPLVYADSHETFVETIKFRITDVNAPAACCSNVLFIPGIKGSVLSKDDLIGGDTLWPPTIWSDDVSQLALTSEGESINEIYVEGVLGDFTVGPLALPIYSPFISFMDRLVTGGTISGWSSLPYDWRFSPETILEEGIKTNNEVVDVIATIEELAASSNTGQISIVAHSMGGIMGKAIIKELEVQGKDNLIDSFVMVGSPQLGTPQAIASLLHGDGEGIPNNVQGYFAILNNSVAEPAAARAIAQQMPSAFNLLPSFKYFDKVSDPVITFDTSASYTEPWRKEWGDSIANHADYQEFLAGQGAIRTKPAANDLNTPEILSSTLLADAIAVHASYDSYVFPEHIRVVEVAGWGRPTAKAIHYTTEHGQPDYNPVFTREGDKTVVYPSALSSQGEEYYFNLFDFNEAFDTDVEHKDLLSITAIQHAIVSVIKEESIKIADHLSDSKPSLSNIDEQLLISAHSPVALGASDSDGNFTGIKLESGEILEEIPGSSLLIFGKSQYIFLPKEGVYDFIYKGTDSGSTTIKVASFVNDIIAPIIKYTDIPTSDTTSATFKIDSESPENTVIQIDENSDGVVDEVVQPDGSAPQEFSLEELVMVLKFKINDLNLQDSLKKKLLKFVAAFEKTLKIKKPFPRKLLSHGALHVFQVEIERLKKKRKLSVEQAAELLDIIAKIKEKI